MINSLKSMQNSQPNGMPRWLRIPLALLMLSVTAACSSVQSVCPLPPAPPASLLMPPPKSDFQKDLLNTFAPEQQAPTQQQSTPKPATIMPR